MSIVWNKVTWYSKLIAVILYVGTFALAFWFGMRYELLSVMSTGKFGLISDRSEVVESQSSDIVLKIGQVGKIKNMYIKLNSLLQDSRCPVQVQCIQAGAVTVEVVFLSGSHAEVKNIASNGEAQEFENRAISITSVSPQKSAAQIFPSDYKLTFHVE